MNQPFLEPLPEDDDAAIWLSVGDLMSAVMLIFALLLIVSLLQLKTHLEESTKGRVLVIQTLQKQLKEAGLGAQPDPETGDVSITDSVLFGHGEHNLKEKGENFLKKFVPVYSRVLFSDPVIEHEVVRVIIEGHTSSDGDPSGNMGLSLNRAHAVTHYIAGMTFDRKEDFMKKVMAAGRGESESRENDDPADRKVMFRFQFKGVEWTDWVRVTGPPSELE